MELESLQESRFSLKLILTNENQLKLYYIKPDHHIYIIHVICD